MKALRNLRIAAKVGSGFGTILVLLLAIAASGIISLTIVGDLFTEYRGLARQTNEVGRVQANMLSTRLGVKNFIIDGSAESIAEVQTRTKATIGIAEAAKGLIDDKERLAVVNDIIARLQAYLEAFDKVTRLQETRNGLVATLDALGPKMEEKLTTILENTHRNGHDDEAYAAAELLRDVLLVRFHANKYLLNNSEEEYKRAEEAFHEYAEAAKTLANLMENSADKALAGEVLESANGYDTALDQVHAAINERNGIITGTLDKIGPAVADLVENTKLEIKEVQDELGPRAQKDIDLSLMIMAVIGAIAVVLGIAAAYLIGTGISRPIVAMTGAMTRLADKDMSVDIPATDHKDEIGDMAASMKVFKENMITADRLAEEQRREQEKQIARAREVEALCRDFDATSSESVRAVAAAATQMQSSSASMSATAEETTRQAAAVAAASEQASANVQTVASAAEELTTSIDEISRQVNQASEIASAAVREAEKTNTQVQGLAEAAKRIGEVVALITDIADQTNLLALNATIEAARAGDAGKGFAVVASEVKNLANQTAKATEEIGAQIGDVQTATQEAVAAIDGIGKIISQINEVNSNVASAVEEQGAATQEIARNVEQAATGTQEVSTNITGVSQAANDTGAASAQIKGAADDLSRQSEKLRSEVDQFLASIQAG